MFTCLLPNVAKTATKYETDLFLVFVSNEPTCKLLCKKNNPFNS